MLIHTSIYQHPILSVIYGSMVSTSDGFSILLYMQPLSLRN